MKKLLTTLDSLSRKALVLLMLTALLVSGAGAAERVITRAQAVDINVVDDVTVSPALDESPPDAEELPGNMTSKARPYCEQSATFNLNLSVSPDYNPNKIRKDFCWIQTEHIATAYVTGETRLCPSLATVHTGLCHNSTLVGHKPSGTI